MECKHFCKEHKGYVIGAIVIIFLIIFISISHEFLERREGKFEKGEGNNYGRNYNGKKGSLGMMRGGEQYNNCGGKNLENGKNNFRAGSMMENKISLPLNMISETDASKIATTTNSGSKITQVYLENEEGVLNYSFILDNKIEVKVDAINGKIVTDKENEGTGTGETNEKE